MLLSKVFSAVYYSTDLKTVSKVFLTNLTVLKTVSKVFLMFFFNFITFSAVSTVLKVFFKVYLMVRGVF